MVLLEEEIALPIHLAVPQVVETNLQAAVALAHLILLDLLLPDKVVKKEKDHADQEEEDHADLEDQEDREDREEIVAAEVMDLKIHVNLIQTALGVMKIAKIGKMIHVQILDSQILVTSLFLVANHANGPHFHHVHAHQERKEREVDVVLNQMKANHPIREHTKARTAAQLLSKIHTLTKISADSTHAPTSSIHHSTCIGQMWAVILNQLIPHLKETLGIKELLK